MKRQSRTGIRIQIMYFLAGRSTKITTQQVLEQERSAGIQCVDKISTHSHLYGPRQKYKHPRANNYVESFINGVRQ